MIKEIFSRIIPNGIRVLINSYIRFPRKKNYGDPKVIEIGAPLLVNPENIIIERYVRIQNNVKLISSGAKLIIKKYSAIGEGCVIIPGSHIPTVGLPQYLSTTHINDEQRGITIYEDCWIGAEVALLSKCNINRGAIIGTRSVVTKDIPPYSVAVGMPAKIIATRFSLEQILKHEQILYPPEERLSEEYLKDLFSTTYKDLKSIGTSEISDSDKELLKSMKRNLNMYPYT